MALAGALGLVGCDGCEQPPPTRPDAASSASGSAQPGPAPSGSAATNASHLGLKQLSATFTDAKQAKERATATPIAFAWDLFLYVNWPAKSGERGVPDPALELGADGLTTWSTWKHTSEVYLPGGKPPDAWKSGDPSKPPLLEAPEIDGRTLTDSNGNLVEFEVRMNEATFSYIVARQLYGYAGQQALRKPGAEAVAFPPGSLEVKATWRLLDPIKDKAILGNYYTRTVTYASDGGGTTQAAAGLTGLHIISKALPNWVWATFEQVDNAKTTEAKLLQPIAPDVAAANAKMQQALQGTVWANYQLIGVMTEPVADGKPVILANSQMETGFQSTSSCLTCHSTASIGPDDNPRFQFFKPGFQGYVGEPPSQPFDAAQGGKFTRLDFVWSLKRARQ
ncbi:MAG: hypothetical protein H6716_19240 [Polyangiaceae bacterium]|nr:hypothetical protein [Polyangiaceae bacterium]